MENLAITVEANCSAYKAFEALTININKWWSTDFSGVATSLNDKFMVRFGNTFKVMKVIELIPNKKIIWECTDSFIDMPELENKKEWNGTNIEWSILSKDDKVIIKMLHNGLTSNVECYEACQRGWTDFIKGSLLSYIQTDQGMPFQLVHDENS